MPDCPALTQGVKSEIADSSPFNCRLECRGLDFFDWFAASWNRIGRNAGFANSKLDNV
jgi:hypothetical protein